MRVGRVVKLVRERKFGFIRADNFRNDIFFHFSTVVGPSKPASWEEGQEVEFDLNEVRRLELGDLEAAKVQVASRPLFSCTGREDSPRPNACPSSARSPTQATVESDRRNGERRNCF